MADKQDLEKNQYRLNELQSWLEKFNLRPESNEVHFYIFDYSPEFELIVRQHIKNLRNKLQPEFVISQIDLFDLAIDVLRSRNLLETAIKMHKEKGDKPFLQALSALLKAEKIADVFIEKLSNDKSDMIFVTGVGSVFPLVRSHLLLNNLQSKMLEVPLVLFYPGSFDGQFLTLFNKLKNKDYYRAFRIVS